MKFVILLKRKRFGCGTTFARRSGNPRERILLAAAFYAYFDVDDASLVMLK